MSDAPLELEDIERAHDRIKDSVRRTPCLRARFLHEPAVNDASLALKLECLQVTGSFKARGASNRLLSLSAEERDRGVITASGGNHGLGVAYAGWRAGVPVRVYLPASTPGAKAEKLERWGARVSFQGDVWDDANEAALAVADREGMTYVYPFADPAVMAGQGTVGLEILKQASDTDTVLVSIGGGGLISGIATAVKAMKPDIRVIGIEPTGAPTLRRSVDAGRVVELASIETRANTLAPRSTAPVNLEVVQRLVDNIVLVDDEQMRDAARWLWFEMGLAVELGAAAAVAALRTGRYTPSRGEKVCALVCGAGTDGIA
jgi:threonine dehydratase